MIDLTEDTIIGQGSNRACYMHPSDKNKCIKVTVAGDFSESEKEKTYYNYLEKLKISWKNLAKYYGSLETTKGDGLIFELVRDADGEVSKTLSYYLQNADRTKTILNPMPLLRELKEYLLAENIMVKDFNTKNMMYQKLEGKKAKLVMIDGLVRSKIFSFSAYSKYLSLQTIAKRYEIFELSLYKKYEFNDVFIQLLNDAR